MAEELDNSIRDNAAGPKWARSDGTEMEQHSLADQIAADRHLASKAATKRKGLDVSTKKLIHPGTD